MIPLLAGIFGTFITIFISESKLSQIYFHLFFLIVLLHGQTPTFGLLLIELSESGFQLQLFFFQGFSSNSLRLITAEVLLLFLSGIYQVKRSMYLTSVETVLGELQDLLTFSNSLPAPTVSPSASPMTRR